MANYFQKALTEDIKRLRTDIVIREAQYLMSLRNYEDLIKPKRATIDEFRKFFSGEWQLEELILTNKLRTKER